MVIFMEDIYMKEALRLATISYKNGDIPVGCVIVKDKEIIGRGFNKKEFEKDASLHAEIVALRDAARAMGSYRLDMCDMYVTLEPCAMCAGAILNFRINKVYIGARNERFGCCGSKINLLDYNFNHTCQCVFGLMEKECSNLISDFFSDLRDKKNR